MKFDVYGYSDKGDRKNNEDAILSMYLGDNFIAEVADGLGGYQAGEVASNCAVSTISNKIMEESSSIETILSAIELANTNLKVQQHNIGNMMSTIALLWISISDSTAVAFNVGDTRVYHFRDKKLLFQSVDHSVAQMAVYTGKISQSEVRSFPDRNKLIRALGANDKVKIECTPLEICSGDSFLICTDGFWEIITEGIMEELLEKSQSSKQWVYNMKDQIDKCLFSRKDNHSAIAIMIL